MLAHRPPSPRHAFDHGHKNGAGIVTPVAGDHDDFTDGGQQDTQSGTGVIVTLDDKNSIILVLVQHYYYNTKIHYFL
jgi:hypothetical protein